VRALVLAALVAAGPRDPPATPPDPLDPQREAMARRLVRLGGEIRRDVEAGNAAALAARVPPEGLRCAGRIVPRSRVERDLRAPGSWIHRRIFGAEGAGARGGEGSLREFFRTAGEVAVAVSFEADPSAGPMGRPCIRFRSRDAAPPLLPLCFVERRGELWFTESLYPCG
jgi:hypothetical protein